MTPYHHTSNKTSLVTAAVAAALGFTTGTAHAVAVTGLTIQDVGSSTANGVGNYSAALDGNSGGFKLSNVLIDPATYDGTLPWTGDLGTGTLLGNGAANPAGSFATGPDWYFNPLTPYTYGNGFVADITNNVLDVTSLDLHVTGYGLDIFPFEPTPDNLFPVEVLWVTSRGNGTDYDVSFRWGHDITTADDPTLHYTSFTAQWIVEGCATTATGGLCAASPVPVPAAAWLFGSGLAGLAGAACRRRKAGV